MLDNEVLVISGLLHSVDLDNVGLEVFADSVEIALCAGKIDRRLTRSIQEIFDHTLKWETAPLEPENIPERHIKLLQWFLTSYESINGRNKLASMVERKVREVTMLFEEGRLQLVFPAELEKLQEKLEYFTVMMRVHVFFDSFGGPPLESEEWDSEGRIKGRKVRIQLHQKSHALSALGILFTTSKAY